MESPIHPNHLQQPLPQPDGSAHIEDERSKVMFGFTIFLLSESIIFVSFFVTLIALKLTAHQWLPPGVSGPEITTPVIINTVVLLSSSIVIYFAERALERNHLGKFRLLWLTTSAMGAYFLVGEIKEWLGLNFGVSTGLVGATFYLLTGFHGLHVTAGIILQMIMLARSFIPGNYNHGRYGVSAVSLFWHFVDAIWIFVFSLLYLWQAT